MEAREGKKKGDTQELLGMSVSLPKQCAKPTFYTFLKESIKSSFRIKFKKTNNNHEHLQNSENTKKKTQKCLKIGLQITYRHVDQCIHLQILIYRVFIIFDDKA